MIIEYFSEDVAKQVIAKKLIEVAGVRYEPKVFEDFEIEVTKKLTKLSLSSSSTETSSAIVLENISINEVNVLLELYSNRSRTGGDVIINSNYDSKTNELVIYYENDEIVNRVIKHGEFIFGSNVYKPKRIVAKDSSSSSGTK